MPGNYLLGPRDLGKPHARAIRAAVKTLSITNKDGGSSGLGGKIHSLIPLSLILHAFHKALTDRVHNKDSIETSSLVWRGIFESPIRLLSRCWSRKTATLNADLAESEFPIRLLFTATGAQRKEPVTLFFQIKCNMPLHLFAGASSSQLG